MALPGIMIQLKANLKPQKVSKLNINGHRKVKEVEPEVSFPLMEFCTVLVKP